MCGDKGMVYNKMNYNDQQQNSQHLLIWLNGERHCIGEPSKLYHIRQLTDSQFIPLLLLKIHPQLFSDIIDKPYDHQAYLSKLEQYLLDLEGLKLKRSYRQLIIQRQSISDIVILILFIVMKHEAKQEFVDRILDLQEETQVFLMNQLKAVQDNVENNMEISEIFQQIQELEDENQVLNEKIRELEIKNEAIMAMKEGLREENQRLFEQNKANMLEKTGVMEVLGVHQMKDYIDMYKDLSNQRVALIHAQQEVEAQHSKLNQQNIEMEEKVEEDRQIVEHLNLEIQRYKNILEGYCIEPKISFMKASKDSITSNKENVKEDHLSVAVIPVRMTKSVDHENQDTTSCSSKYLPTLEDDEESITLPLKQQHVNLNAKLQVMYGRIKALNSEVLQLKEEKHRLAKNNRKKEKIIALAQREFMEFRLNYQFTISG